LAPICVAISQLDLSQNPSYPAFTILATSPTPAGQ
jgi:hypothetical protein